MNFTAKTTQIAGLLQSRGSKCTQSQDHESNGGQGTLVWPIYGSRFMAVAARPTKNQKPTVQKHLVIKFSWNFFSIFPAKLLQTRCKPFFFLFYQQTLLESPFNSLAIIPANSNTLALIISHMLIIDLNPKNMVDFLKHVLLERVQLSFD